MTTPRLSLSLSHSFALRSFARSIRKDEPKVVDTADTTAQDKPQGTCVVVVVPPTTLAHELTKSLTHFPYPHHHQHHHHRPVAYCRCWRSGTFPLCDGAHMKHNESCGDNVGPLLVKK